MASASSNAPGGFKDPYACFPFMMAAKAGNVQEVKQFLDSGKFTVDTVQIGSFSSLHYAAQYGHLALVKLLLHRGADAKLRSPLGCPQPPGKSAEDLAKDEGNDEIVALLKAFVKAKTPEERAAVLDYTEVGEEEEDEDEEDKDGWKTIKHRDDDEPAAGA
jgi:ankyrin repeat protein